MSVGRPDPFKPAVTVGRLSGEGRTRLAQGAVADPLSCCWEKGVAAVSTLDLPGVGMVGVGAAPLLSLLPAAVTTITYERPGG